MTKGQGFARAVLEAFSDAEKDTDAEVRAAGGPSNSTMTKIRKVAEGRLSMDRPRGDTLEAIDNAADWAPGTAKRKWREFEGAAEQAAAELRSEEPGLGEMDAHALAVRILAADEATRERLLRVLRDEEVS